MNVADLVGLVALLKKVVDAARYMTAKQINGLVTQVFAWGAGVGGTFLVAQTQWAHHISVGNGSTLANQGAFSLTAIGLAIASGGSVLTDISAALDNTNTSVIPPLLHKYAVTAQGLVTQAQLDQTDGVVPLSPTVMTHVRQVIADEFHRYLGGGKSTTVSASSSAPPPPPAPDPSAATTVPVDAPAPPPPPPPSV